MKRIALTIFLLAVAAAPAMAQNAPQTATLTADGVGMVFAQPDTVIITIGVTTRGDTPAAALDANSTDMQSVIDAILGAGVDEADVTTSGFSISPVYSNQRDEQQPQRITGYTVSNQVTVRIRDIATSGDVLNQVVAAGANQINGIRFDIAEPQPLQDEAMAAAIADAQRKAELMAEAAGVQLVRVLTVSAYANSGPQPQYDLMRAAVAVPIMGGEQAITANATLQFEIAPR
jgi:uncharacterized protein YggE